MEVYRTKDGQVSKYVHNDGSETAIKTIGSCNNIINPLTGKLEDLSGMRKKVSIFVSCSVGCIMKCKFCYLTSKKCSYHKLNTAQILTNIQEAYEAEIVRDPSLKEKYVKLSFMGMGDALSDTKMVLDVSMMFFTWLMANDYTIGLDGVDISTTYPNIKSITLTHLSTLNEMLSLLPFNPDHEPGRSCVRIFYSLFSLIEPTRREMIPNSKPIHEAIGNLDEFSRRSGINLLFHHLFLDGINDSTKDKEYLELIFNRTLKGRELRVLRFNACPHSEYKESKDIEKIVHFLSDNLDNVKFQVSTGSEIKSACGQFIVKEFLEKK